MEKKFYLIDANSDNYFVGRIKRTDNQIIEPLRELAVGQTYWFDDNKGWERFE